MARLKCSTYVLGDPDHRKRFIVDTSLDWSTVLTKLSAKFGGLDIAEVLDKEGCQLEAVDEILDDETLVLVPTGTDPKLRKALVSTHKDAGDTMLAFSTPEVVSEEVASAPVTPAAGAGAGDSPPSSDSSRKASDASEEDLGAVGSDASSEPRTELSPAGPRAAAAPQPEAADPYLTPQVAQPSDIVELQVLNCARANDFAIESAVGGGQNGMVFAATCRRVGIPRPDKLYAVKLVFNYGAASNAVRNKFENEYIVLSQMEPHPNINRFWSQFLDTTPPAAMELLPAVARDFATYTAPDGSTKSTKVQFVVLDHHPSTLQAFLESQALPLPFSQVHGFVTDLLQGIAHMSKYNVAHLDLKVDNVLVAADNRLVLCDFGTAIRFPNDRMELAFHPHMVPGGNQPHLAPEVINAFNAMRRGDEARVLPYSCQEVWAVGALTCEIACGVHPWPGYPTSCMDKGAVAYKLEDMPPFPESYPDEFVNLVRRMLAFDPSRRVSAVEALSVLATLPTSGSSVPVFQRPLVVDCAPGTSTKTVYVKTVFGDSTAVSIALTAPVSDVIVAAVSALFPHKDPAAFRVLHCGKLLDGDAPVTTVDGESCVFLVEPRSTPSAATPAASPGPAAAESESKDVPSPPPSPAPETSPAAAVAPWALPAAESFSESKLAPVTSPALQGFYRFNETARNPKLRLTEHGQVAECDAVWSSVFVNVPPVSSGKLVFAVRMVSAEQGCGVAVGVAVPGAFDPEIHNLGAHDMSWAYSKTGKTGRGHGFSPYSDSFYTGDTITVEADLDAGTLRFLKNGIDLGVAFDDLAGNTVVPAICLGSNSGGNLTRVRLVTPGVRVFDSTRCNSRIRLLNDDTSAETESKWATCLLAHNGVAEGVVAWSVSIDSAAAGAGVAIGVVDPTMFDYKTKNLGVYTGSWCYSKTGNKSDGVTGMQPYGDAYGEGDVITVVLDADLGTLRFEVNGKDQGVAASTDLVQRPLVPAVCLGSSSGGRQARVSIVRPKPPAIVPARLFSSSRRNGRISLHKGNTVADTRGRWASALLDHPGVTRGVLLFAVTVLEDSGSGGLAIGFADSQSFEADSMSLGAVRDSWCYSKTGKRSDVGPDGVGRFVPYGSEFKAGDTVTAEVDMDRDMARFWVNGLPQGVAFEGMFSGRCIVPGIVMGSAEGGLLCRVKVVVPCVTQLDPSATHPRMMLENWGTIARCDQKWCTAVLAHPGVWEGQKFRFACRLVEGDGGFAIGVVDPLRFDVMSQNIGAAPGTWCLSRTGKKSNGSGFQPYCRHITPGDAVGVEVDNKRRTIRFFINGTSMGTAFSKQFKGVTLVPAICAGSNDGGRPTLIEIIPAHHATGTLS